VLTGRTFTRRDVVRAAAAGAGALALAGAEFAGSSLIRSSGLIGGSLQVADVQAGSVYIEVYPTSPLILNPFQEELPIPDALPAVSTDVYSKWTSPPGPDVQDYSGQVKHQIWPNQLGLPNPIVYQVKVSISTHRFTSSRVLPISADGTRVVPPRKAPVTVGSDGSTTLPDSVIFGYNGKFPGARINAEYGKPALVRFENHLGENPNGLDLQDFGAPGPDFAFLTHLHNGHTAPESDGNPHFRHQGYLPGQFVDNLYLNYPAGGDDREKQSFFWFHDHFHNFTGANVYKGLAGLYPIYDPKNRLDMGDERYGLRLPGVRTNHPDGSFDVDYDVPLVLYDVRLEDGVTPHKDFHNGQGEPHPEWWGKSFFRHFPNHGFVGDIFTVNGVAFPTLEVKRRKYRLRFLDASVSRIYAFQLMRSTRGHRAARDLGLSGDELQANTGSLTESNACASSRSQAKVACCPTPSCATRSSSGRPSGASSSSTSRATWTAS
jgi:FtsP/CotA-like multicopper oxidase with cupredoxin domain